jgi:hypothetical protein
MKLISLPIPKSCLIHSLLMMARWFDGGFFRRPFTWFRFSELEPIHFWMLLLMVQICTIKRFCFPKFGVNHF